MADTVDFRNRRALQFFRSILGGAVARPISLVCVLLQTPIALNALGGEGFGFWLSLVAAFNTFMIFDFGLSFAMQNRVSHAHASGNFEEMRSVCLHVIFWLAGIGAILLILCAALSFSTDWARLFKLTDPANKSQATICIVVTAVAFSLNLPCAVAQRLAIGLQLSWLASLSALAASVFSLAVVWGAAYVRLPLAWFVTLTFMPFILSNAVLLFGLFQHFEWTWRRPAPFPNRQDFLRNSTLFLLPQFGSALVFNAPPVLIALLAGAHVVTPFALALRITSLLSQTAALLLAPLWPAYTEASARGDFEWIRATFRRATVATVAGAGIGALLIAWCGEALVRFWVSDQPGLPSRELMCLLAIWTFACCVGQSYANLLNGLGHLKGQATYGFASAIVSIMLMLLLTPPWGATGAAVSLLAGYILINCPGFLLETHRLFKTLHRSAQPHSPSSFSA